MDFSWNFTIGMQHHIKSSLWCNINRKSSHYAVHMILIHLYFRFAAYVNAIFDPLQICIIVTPRKPSCPRLTPLSHYRQYCMYPTLKMRHPRCTKWRSKKIPKITKKPQSPERHEKPPGGEMREIAQICTRKYAHPRKRKKTQKNPKIPKNASPRCKSVDTRKTPPRCHLYSPKTPPRCHL